MNTHTNNVTIFCVTCAYTSPYYFVWHMHVHQILIVALTLTTDVNSTNMDIDGAMMATNEPMSKGEHCDIALAIWH
jgi:hypothetical protein